MDHPSVEQNKHSKIIILWFESFSAFLRNYGQLKRRTKTIRLPRLAPSNPNRRSTSCATRNVPISYVIVAYYGRQMTSRRAPQALRSSGGPRLRAGRYWKVFTGILSRTCTDDDGVCNTQVDWACVSQRKLARARPRSATAEVERLNVERDDYTASLFSLMTFLVAFPTTWMERRAGGVGENVCTRCLARYENSRSFCPINSRLLDTNSNMREKEESPRGKSSAILDEMNFTIAAGTAVSVVSSSVSSRFRTIICVFERGNESNGTNGGARSIHHPRSDCSTLRAVQVSKSCLLP